MKRYTLREVKASYEQKRDWEKQFPVSRFIFRPLSFPLTALILRFTSSPAAVAWAGLAVGLAASWMLLEIRTFGPWPGIAGLVLFALLDAVDGNMARTTGSVTRYGKLLDGALGKLAEGLYFPALSTGLYLANYSGRGGSTPPHSTGMLLSGFVALIAMLYSSYIESAYDALSNEAKERGQPDVTAQISSSRFRNNIFYAAYINLGAFNLQAVLLAIAAVFGCLEVFLLAFEVYYLVRFALLYSYYLHRAAAELSGKAPLPGA
jgi:phosphatidylglycerophosphate synthase